ncbi:MAG: Asp-tRNA(Asn)/Glu-tRNA(Gln) amidotransferase subunit GatC [Chitinophagales bacterium]|nr:Asp-tRNA(Asn)/Glu-tRNA(Gln) amidotransferase subunit GatC [Bacteroidota bacterium]MCB9042572.1 Asp-tRNA(Asn)/Glu-tRNA(Gln) amidotransferase subunit GatC [Chitinophagales bacterium]
MYNTKAVFYFSMEITDELIDKLAHLAKLNISEEERPRYKKDLAQMLDFVAQIQAFEVPDDTAPLRFMSEETNVWREDVAKKLNTRAESLQNSVQHNEQYFEVPKVIDKKD